MQERQGQERHEESKNTSIRGIREDKEPATQLSWGNGTMDILHASREEIDMLRDLLQSGSVSEGFHEAILRIVSEEAGAYFSGSKSAEQVAQIIQNRMQLYMAE